MQTLSGMWKIATDPTNIGREERWFETTNEGAEDAQVPGIIQQVFPEYHGVVWYWKTFRLPRRGDNEQRVVVHFEVVDYFAQVYVNGRAVGEHEGGETPFEVDITDTADFDGENLLAVRVLNPTAQPIDNMTLVDTPNAHAALLSEWQPGQPYNFGGIMGSVELRIVPALRVSDVYVRPDIATGRITASVTVKNDGSGTRRAELHIQVTPVHGGDVLAGECTSVECQVGTSEHATVVTLPEFRLWDIDEPNLYRVTIRLSAPGTDAHEHSVRCGFREFRVEKGYFRLNGRRIFLKSGLMGDAHYPIGQKLPPTSDMMRRDLVMAKATGYNMIRFIAGMAWKEQLDFCDEIGLLVNQESRAGWMLGDSPHMTERYDRSLRDMILRDRNHPSVVIWGLLNETCPGPVFKHAVQTLPLIRSLDNARMVLLNSGRFDLQPGIGSLSNPGSSEWDYEWGNEGPHHDDKVVEWIPGNSAQYYGNMGDLHAYPQSPHTPETNRLIRSLGSEHRPVFFSEYGTGSSSNIIGELGGYEQFGASEDLPDVRLFRSMLKRFLVDWERWGLADVYAFPEDFLLDSQRWKIRYRRLGFDLIRSNPKICGYSVTEIVDAGIAGAGVWTFWRKWAPESAEMLSDGWSPLRWCLFVDPPHGYGGSEFTFEAVLANEDVLPPGEYPACVRVFGPQGLVWEKQTPVSIPSVPEGEDGPLAVPVLKETLKLDIPAGTYEFRAMLLKGGAPAGERVTFHVSRKCHPFEDNRRVRTLGIDQSAKEWLAGYGVECVDFDQPAGDQREIILVGRSKTMLEDVGLWRRLARRIGGGDVAVFLDPAAFNRTKNMAKIGRLVRTAPNGISKRDFQVANVPEEEWPVYRKEFFGQFTYTYSELPDADYTVELGMCEGCIDKPGGRVFNVLVNGEFVLRNLDIVAETGGPHLALIKTLHVRPRDGQMTIEFRSGPENGPSLSRLRIYDESGRLIAEDVPGNVLEDPAGWIPLAEKGKCALGGDPYCIYRTEYVAKRHPIFADLSTGIIDWFYYGPVMPKGNFLEMPTPEDTAAVGFGVGMPIPGGYASSLVVGSYPLGAGHFVLNGLDVLGNLGQHPVADRLLLNMIVYASAFAKGKTEPPPTDFEKTLETIGYLET